jgi:uncharacterized protein (TIGR00251 family)
VPVRTDKHGVVIDVRVTPKSSRSAVVGVESDAAGRRWLKVRVTAPPESGKANEALVKLLADALKIPKTAVSVERGAGDRRKLVRLSGDAGDLGRAVEALLARLTAKPDSRQL